MNPKDGGPAYPIPLAGCTDGGVYNILEQSGGRYGGMSLRDHFAGLAMQALIARTTANQSPQHVADKAIEHADAMLIARARRIPIDLPNIQLPWTPDTAPPPAPVAEWKEPTPEECERISIHFANNHELGFDLDGRAMFDAVRAVMWPKGGES